MSCGSVLFPSLSGCCGGRPAAQKQTQAAVGAKDEDGGSTALHDDLFRLDNVEPLIRYRTLAVSPNEWAELQARAAAATLAGKRRPRLMVTPGARTRLAWNSFVMLVDFIYTSLLVPVSIAFSSITEGRVNWITIVDFCGSAVYLADMAMEFRTGFFVRWDVQRELVMDSQLAARFYVRHGTFSHDVLAAGPPLVLMAVLLGIGGGATWLKAFYLLRLLRMIHISRHIRMLQLGQNATYGGQMLRRYFSIGNVLALTALMLLFTLVNFMGCIWWFVAIIEGVDESWAAHIASKQDDLLFSTDAVRWLFSCYFSLTTVTTIGYGDIVPFTVAEVAITMVFQILAVAAFGYLLGTMMHLFAGTSRNDRLARELMEKMQDVDAWLGDRHISRPLAARVRHFYASTWALLRSNNDAKLLSEMPAWLRVQLMRELEATALKAAPSVQGLAPESRDRVWAAFGAASMPVFLAAGDIVFSCGAPANSIYILDQGATAVVRGGVRSPSVSSPAFISLSAFFSSLPECSKYLVTVQAVSNSKLWKVDVALARQRLSLEDVSAMAKVYREHVENILSKWAAIPPSNRLEHVELAAYQRIADAMRTLCKQQDEELEYQRTTSAHLAARTPCALAAKEATGARLPVENLAGLSASAAELAETEPPPTPSATDACGTGGAGDVEVGGSGSDAGAPHADFLETRFFHDLFTP